MQESMYIFKENIVKSLLKSDKNCADFENNKVPSNLYKSSIFVLNIQ